MMKLIGKKVLVKQMRTKDKSEGGIALPDSMSSALPYGKIISISLDLAKDPENTLVVPGAIVLFSAIAAIPLELKPDHVLIEPDDILAILEEGDY